MRWEHRWWNAGLLSLVGLVPTALAPTTALAQSFTYQTLNTTLTVPFVLDTLSRPDGNLLLNPESSDFIRDPFGTVNPMPPSGPPGITVVQRIVANQRLRYRLIGNPNIRSGGIRFTWLSMNRLDVSGPGTYDRVEVQWFFGSPASLTGDYTATATNLTVGTSGNDSWMWPGMVFTTITGPDIDGSSSTTLLDRESWGYLTEGVRVTGNGTEGSSIWPTLGMYDSAIGVTLANDDVVDTLVATTGHPISVVLRLPPHDLASGVILWARCGAPPVATAYDRKVWTNTEGGAFFQMTPCPSGQALHVSVTNTSNRPRAFRLYVSSYRTDREWTGVKVGVAWSATASEMNDIRTAFRRAAWQFFGMTGGTHVIRSYRYYHDAVACDDGWPADQAACYGSPCDVCLAPSTGRANYNGRQVTLYRNAGADSHWMQGGSVIIHEFGHKYAGLADEYVEFPGGTFAGCAHTRMASAAENQVTLCTPANHRATGYSFPYLRTHQGPVCVNASGVVYQVSSSRSQWQELWEDGAVTTQFPSTQSQDLLRMREFFSSTVIGRCDFGC